MNVTTDYRIATLAADLKHGLIDDQIFISKVMELAYSAPDAQVALELFAIDDDAITDLDPFDIKTGYQEDLRCERCGEG